MASHRQPLAEASTNIAVTAPPKSAKPDLLEIDSDDERLQYITDNCDQVRRKINAFIQSGEMKIGAFCDAIGVSNRSYNMFLKESGKFKGAGSATYQNAAIFFKKRELQGLKPPKAKKAKTSAADLSKYDVSDIYLDGEDTCEVPVYDTCDGARKKMRALIRKGDLSQAALAREMSKSFPDDRTVNTGSVTAFLAKKGPNAGNTMAIFYAAYVFFEKLRIKEGKPKDAFRLEMERLWGREGFDITRPSHRGLWCGPGDVPYVNEYGRVHIQRRG